jgi:phosphomannomutase
MDGSFPHHEANPIKPENIKDIKERVRTTQAHFGVAFDGDADRVVFIDEHGEMVAPDMAFAIFVADRLEQQKGPVVYDLRISMSVEDLIKAKKGIAIKSRVGHTYIQKRMAQEQGVLGGELSGHYYFPEFFYADCALLAMIHMINIISSSDQSLSALVKDHQKYYRPGEINFTVKDTDAVLTRIKDHYKDIFETDMDGISCRSDDFWFTIRPSNTEPVVRLTLEARTQKIMEETLDTIKEIVSSV